MKKLLFVLIFFFPLVSIGQSTSDFPQKTIGYVHDYENVLTNEQLTDLEIMANEIQKITDSQIIIISINNIGTYSNFDQYALDLSNHWEIGKNYNGNGLSIIFSKSLRKIRISTTNSIKEKITDQFCQEIIGEIIIPSFKKDDYYTGINDALLKIGEKLQ